MDKMPKSYDRKAPEPYSGKSIKKRTSNDDFVPFGISFDGTVPKSIARIVHAICRLVEECVDWLIWKLHKNRYK
jgi:hypothetical protein